MLEKLGLPPKPSARGRSWVIDASHCQQCGSQFSIFNRKHHCRRCGGLFCGNCVQSRMILRGQGDSPVRICEPCKQLELATRFEARHGRKKKDEASLEQDELLIKSLLNEETHESSSSSAVEPVTPESLRTKAQNEKEKATTLRKEGKTEEATKAYKRSKELEKQADTLALALRKNSKKPAPSPSSSRSSRTEVEVTTQTLQKVSTEKKKSAGDEDLLKELKDLGWSEPDLNTKQASDAEILSESGGQKSGKAGALQMEILGHKRRALALKREGKLAEAKEELRLAKTLEKRLEEIETLGEDDEDDEEDDDELSSVLKALEKEIDHHQPGKPVQLTPESLPLIREDEDDDQVDVSEKDMSDPEMLAALKAMGWAEESRVLERLSSHREEHLSKQELQAKILSHKRSALALKRAGNLVEARRELAEAKALERTLGASSEAEVLVQEPENVEVTEHDMRDPEMMAALRALGFGGDDQELVDGVRVKDEEKRSLQREALDARRASEAALKRGSVREEAVMNLGFDDQPVKLKFDARVRTKAPSISDDDEEEDVMSFVKDLSRDPEVAPMLQGLSLDEKNEQAPTPAPAPAPTTRKVSKKRVVTPVELPNRSKRELQQELLGKKRLALSLRREGKEEEAERVMKEASALEMQMKALEEAEKNQTQTQPQSLEIDEDDDEEEENDEVTEDDMMDPTLLAALSAIGFKDEAAEAGMVSKAVTKKIVQKAPPEEVKVDEDDAAGLEGEYGEIGQVVEVPSGFIHPFFSRFSGSSVSDNKQKQAQAQQAQVQQVQAPVSKQAQAQQVQAKQQVQPAQAPSKEQVQSFQKPAQAQTLPSKQAEQEQVSSSSSSVEQQILELKRTALRMKKSGDLAGAKEELRKAKLLENSQQQQIKTPTTTTETKVVVKVEQKKTESTFKDRMKLQRESLAHKRRALTLRREGKAEEAEAEFELAKSLEKQMEELEGSQAPGALDEGVEDVIDSQLAGALEGLGFELPSSSSPQPKIQPKITAAPTIQSSSKITQAPQLESSVQEKIRSLRLRALELKRSGKQQEALQALREAKMLEKGS